jgi:hypothetical protein
LIADEALIGGSGGIGIRDIRDQRIGEGRSGAGADIDREIAGIALSIACILVRILRVCVPVQPVMSKARDQKERRSPMSDNR